jgi:hypothetical protein
MEVGFTETITPNDCHFQPYNVSYDLYGNIVKDYQKGSRYGYKKITDDLYNSYYEVGNGYTASRAYESDFSKAKPTFAFAAEIFREYYIDEAEGTTTYFVDPVMSTVASTFYYGVGNDINLYGIFATSDVYVSINEQYKPYVVVKDGYIIEAGFYFFVGSIYGIVEIQSKECPDGFVSGRLPRSKEWSEKISKSRLDNPTPLTDELRKKLRDSHLGHKFSDEHKKKLSLSSKGRKWYNNGVINKFARECPEGFVPGKLPYKKINKF